MRILQLCKFYPPVKGGMESVVHSLSAGFAARGFEVEVLCASTALDTVRERISGVDVVRAASYGRLHGLSLAPSLVRLCRDMVRDADIVHIHMPDPLTAFALWISRCRSPVVVHWHSDVVRQRLARWFYGPLQGWLLRRADAIVATSQPYALSSPWLRRHADKVIVVPIGIGDNSALPPIGSVAAIHRRYANRHIVFALGRMVSYKGFDVLIDAAALLPAHAVVVVGGEGDLLDRHRQTVAERGLGKKIHFVGRMSELDCQAHFAAARVFCLPSTQRSEAFGVVVVEAMAAGRPVVASAIAGSGVGWVNVDGVTGLNVPVGDAESLAAALTRLVDDDEFAFRCGQAARARFVGHLTADAMVDRTADLYGRLLAAPAPVAAPH